MLCEMHMFSFFSYIYNYILSSYIPVGFIFIPGQTIIQKNNIFEAAYACCELRQILIFSRENSIISGKFRRREVFSRKG